MKIRIMGKNWTVTEHTKGRQALIRYGKGLTCPTHIYNFVRFNDNKVNCDFCGYEYKIEDVKKQ